jgi:WD40 repeat protein
VLFCAADMDVVVLDTATGRKIETLKGHQDVITSVYLSLPWLLTGSRDATIKVWSTRTWRCVRTISAPGVRCLSAISPQHLLLVGLDSGQLQWWKQGPSDVEQAGSTKGEGMPSTPAGHLNLPAGHEPVTAGGSHFANM